MSISPWIFCTLFYELTYRYLVNHWYAAVFYIVLVIDLMLKHSFLPISLQTTLFAHMEKSRQVSFRPSVIDWWFVPRSSTPVLIQKHKAERYHGKRLLLLDRNCRSVSERRKEPQMHVFMTSLFIIQRYINFKLNSGKRTLPTNTI